MCVNTRTGRKENNVWESYGDPDTRSGYKGEDTPGEEIWNSLEGEGPTALVNIIRKYDYELLLCGCPVTCRDTFTLHRVLISRGGS